MHHALATVLLLLAAATVHAQGVDTENNAITISPRTEPPNLDSSMSEDTTSGQVLRMINEGLVRVGARGKILPGVAERWEMDVMKATFHLREDARWEDGKPVTAHDFVYAMQRLVNPKTGALGSTLFAYVLDGAEEIMRGERPPEELGVRALDDVTLELTLSRPVPYLLQVLSSTPYFPLRQDFVEAQGERHAADAVNLLSNGPFKLSSWVHSASLDFEVNDEYWDRENIGLDAQHVGYITADVRALLNLFNSGDIAALNLNEEILDEAANAGIRILKKPMNCIAWVSLNMREDRLTSDRRVREAIRLAFDRDSYVNSIIGLPGVMRIDSPFSRQIQGVKGSFPREYPSPEIDYDLNRARALIDEVRSERGGELPPLVLLANETRQVEAEFIQAQLQSGLGLEVRVDKQTFKQAIAKMRQGAFDLTRLGFCGGQIRDPIVYATVFETNSPFNDNKYSNDRYDELIAMTHDTIDPVMRMEAFAEMQALLYRDIPIIPTHSYSYVYIEDARVKGLQRYPTVDFTRGYIAE